MSSDVTFLLCDKKIPQPITRCPDFEAIILTILGEASLFIITMHYVCLIGMQLHREEGFKIFSDLENCPMTQKKKKKYIKKNFRQTPKNSAGIFSKPM